MSREYQRYLASREWAAKREAVRHRSGGQCERCRAHPMVAVHHLTYERIGKELLTDLIAVCGPCHEFLSAKSPDDPLNENGRREEEIQGRLYGSGGDGVMSTYKFNNEGLRCAVDDTKNAIAQRNEKLDRISEDIKQLEHYLETSGVRQRLEVGFGEFGRGGGAVGDFRMAAEFGGGPAEEICEFLMWEKLANQNRWRIMYRRTRREGEWNEDIPGLFYFEGEPEVVDHRPLIETSWEIRLRASEVLPELVKAMAEAPSPQ